MDDCEVADYQAAEERRWKMITVIGFMVLALAFIVWCFVEEYCFGEKREEEEAAK